MAEVSLLVTIPEAKLPRYHEHLAGHEDMQLNFVSSQEDAVAHIADSSSHYDVLIFDSALGDSFAFIREVRHKYPRLVIILIDEEADFGLPGQADEMITTPFENNRLILTIERIMSDRRMETLRSDGLPAMQSIARNMKKAAGAEAKQEAAVQSILDMGYDYVAFYALQDADAPHLKLTAHEGPKAIKAIAPQEATADDLMGWVARNKQSRLASPDDQPNHALVARGRLGEVACVPVSFSGSDYGVIAACRDRPGTITQENVMMLELVATQLAGALRGE